ncbi:hypothetical protein AKN87_09340 [Thiopseudomonas alkaliphila]|uniref:GTP-binding protein n=1 Tax=Thiopseudomonas alkaliphila TaxID=1697053 RepID=UPI00069DA6D3|nr:GTP-binding protein [Thiopseudomonas alkaliphila]AKX45266.1 hypothetical protein AKN87_09340 [Thiopseudomonas alkaliphila]AKX51042.1 hypothetical protein AKN92_05640 [Thiopseudomonas alkaliphila]AKX57400.1 hypothetical protein AKN89_05820 [Thiopseudomonas alkaliphila]
MSSSSSHNLISVTLLTGLLDSGKTIVLNHLVQQTKRADILVIINKLGGMGLDHLLVRWLKVLMNLLGSNILILRVKGFLNVEGHDKPIVIHGSKHIFHPPVPSPTWPTNDHRSRLVFITQDVSKSAIEATFRAFQQVFPQATESAR